MEVLIVCAILYGGWWLLKGKKEHNRAKHTFERWQNAPSENAAIAKDYGWTIVEVQNDDILLIILQKTLGIANGFVDDGYDDIETTFSLYLSKEGYSLSEMNFWLEDSEREPMKSATYFNIHQIETHIAKRNASLAQTLYQKGYLKRA